MTQEDINRLYTQYLGRGIGAGDPTAQRLASGQNETDLIRELLGSQERGLYTQGVANQRTTPAYNIGLQDLTQNKALGLANIGQQQTELGNYYSDLMQGLERTQTQQQGRLLSNQSQLGLLRSGGTSTGMNEIGRQTTQATGQAMQDKANKLATLALQKTGLENIYASGVQRLDLARSTDIQNILDQLRSTGEQNLAQAKQTQLQQEENARQLELQKFEVSQSIPQGQSIDVPGLGRVEGTKIPTPVKRDTSTITANGRTLLIDNQTGAIIQDLGSAYKTSGGGSPATSTPTTANQAVKTIQNAVNAGENILDLSDQILDLPLSDPEKKTVLGWFYKNYKVNINSPQGQKALQFLQSNSSNQSYSSQW